MFRRLVSALLIVVLSVGSFTPALAEGVSAGELLFGSADAAPVEAGQPPADAQPVVTAQPENQPQTDVAAQPADAAQSSAGLEEDVYGANDQTSVYVYQTLQLGDRDLDDGAAYIVMLQNRLLQLGFLQGAADGVFGQDTKTAIEQFQKLNGLEQTGIADAQTQTLLFSDAGTLATPSPENPVVYGSMEERVQTKLSEWGFMVGAIDGKLGDASKQGIIRFKKYVLQVVPQAPTPSPVPTPSPTPVPTPAPGELPSIVDEPLPAATPSLEERCNSELNADIMDYIDGQRPFEVYYRTVQNGDKNEDAYRVQVRLKQLGYLYPDPDGKFGDTSELALKYFQRKHGLEESGIADEATQRRLFSDDVKKSEGYVFPYTLIVDISDQRVHVYGWDGDGYDTKIGSMICSTGKDATPTPLGTYQAWGRAGLEDGEWYYFKTFNCYAKYAYGVVGGILFHSVTYSKNKKLNQGSVNNLGRKASHGCIRLEIDKAKWIYDNCPNGTTVIIRE